MKRRTKRLTVGGFILVGIGCAAGTAFIPWFGIGCGVSLLCAAATARYVKTDEQQVQPAVQPHPPLRHYPHPTVIAYDLEEILEPRPSNAPSPSLLFVHGASRPAHQINLSIDQRDIIPGMTNLDEKGRPEIQLTAR